NGSRLKTLEQWKVKATNFSTSDNIGTILTKTIELIIAITKDGIKNAFLLEYAMKMIDSERNEEMRKDSNRDVPYRQMFYGICESLNLMIESLMERTKEEAQQAVVIDTPRKKSVESQLPVTSSIMGEMRFPYNEADGSFVKEEDEEMEIG
ncbi:hypothetical protein PENTCL1PPCAC_11125, partial [Pristionchus entomophagus]